MPVICTCGADIERHAFEIVPEGAVERALDKALSDAAASVPESQIRDAIEDLLVETSVNLWLCPDCGRLAIFGQDQRFARSYAPDAGSPQWTIAR